MRLFLCILILLAGALPCHADRLYTEAGITRDGDESGHYRLLGGYRFDAGESVLWEIDAAGGTRNYWEKLPAAGNRTTREKESFEVARIGLRGTAPKLWRFDLRGEQLYSDNWDVTLGAATVSARPNENWYLELFGERELVDTVRAIRERIRFETYGLSADYRLNSSWTLVAALLRQEFSDGNRRDGGIGRLIYTPEGLEWLHLQLKGRILDAEQPSASYFSPERLQEYFLLVGIAAPFAGDNWIFHLLAGPGTQIIEPFGSPREQKEAYLAELKLRGWLSERIAIESRAGCSTAVTSVDTYAYCYGQLHLGYAW